MVQAAKQTLQYSPMRLTMSALSFIVFLIILASAISNFLTIANPHLALFFNPLNAPARINILSSNLAQNLNSTELARIKQIAVRGIELDPMDARFYSLLGVINETKKKTESAQLLYLHSLKLLPTEIQALTRRFVYSVNTGKFVQAVSLADVILRRWKTQWKLIAPYMSILLRDKAAYQEARVRFSKYRIGRERLIDSLSKDTTSITIARRLIKDWYNQGADGLRPVINNLTAKLIDYNQYHSAYRLFLLTLSNAEQEETGYIFNGNFVLQPTGSLFDWQPIRQAGVSSKFRDLRIESSSGSIIEKVFELRFLGAPIRFSKILQNLILPPSQITLKLIYSTLDLRTVKPIILQIECRKNGKALASLRFGSGSIEKKEVEVTFKVPDTNCTLLQIRIYNGNFVESWKNRYSGSLFLHKVTMSLGGV